MSDGILTNAEREAAEARFGKLFNSPAIRKSCGLDHRTGDPNDGDTRPEFNPNIPSCERVDAVIRACRGAL